MSLTLLRRTILIVGAAVAIAAAALPSASYGAPPTGGGSGDSGYCDTLKARLKLFHDISKDKSQPARVRAFYKARANAVLSQAKQEGCSWAQGPAALRGAGDTGTPTGTRAAIASVKASSTGNKDLDDFCRKVADLINEAERAGDDAAVSGDIQGSNEWYALADYYIERASRHGCRFMDLRQRSGAIRPPQTIAVSPR